jgi:hypothetical protein
LGKTHTDETKFLMSQAHLGTKNSMYGKFHTEQSKSLISLARKGKVHDNKTNFFEFSLVGTTRENRKRKKQSLGQMGLQYICMQLV